MDLFPNHGFCPHLIALRIVSNLGICVVEVEMLGFKIGLSMVDVVHSVFQIGLSMCVSMGDPLIKLGLWICMVLISATIGLLSCMVLTLATIGLLSCTGLILDTIGLLACMAQILDTVGLLMCMVFFLTAVGLLASMWALVHYLRKILKVLAIFRGMLWGEVELEME